ncbi:MULTISPECIES: folylpolyglutamate synthase/dihydrofolate synthase family protein [Fusobacterium]|uniref:bifunctional folylpolyglutamate synthase/dihydrofolate synthase n=1 Tax=Fusobacterium TaxID=848 RepID=UPI001477509D|nr:MULTISPECIES: folylpolyglutamate synthase/dihydrofolate synthase family protein [Fusobacterium]NME36190.1 bifunctional folylpolyglutamate synthase/dihydrofolate synthase [Fusobacterium sp. FSA-380-WT-3A]
MEMQELLNELYSYSLHGIKLGLENIEKICEALGNPQNNYKIIHITGTNGKGSTSTIIETVLLKAGYSVGKYTSPHILKFNERIRVDGEDIPDKDIAEIYKIVREKIEELKITPTFFEVTTAMMFLYFARKKIEYAILEVGMGGRFDATNVVNSDIAIITNVSLDHIEYLGKTIYEISREKAGIIKDKSYVIVGDSQKEFLKAIKEKTEDFVNVIDKYKNIDYKLNFEKFNTDIFIGDKKYQLSLFGDYQVKNFLCAYEALCKLEVPESVIKEAIKEVVWQCRFEIYEKNPVTILEGAHNIDGIKNLKQIIEKGYLKEKVVMIVSILKDKKIEEMLKVCEEISENIILTSLSENPRGLSAKKLYEFTDKSQIFTAIEDIKEAYNFAKNLNKEIIIVCGSFYTCEKFKREVGLC